MSAGSVSNIELYVTLKGKARLTLELKRHLAPKTVGVIMRSLPIEGNAHTIGNSIAFMDTTINAGGEKLRTQFKKGDVAFMASNGSICFFIDEVSSSKPMTLIGRITLNLDLLKNLNPGDIFLISQIGT